ncbi:kinase-like protein [Fomitiporia mediterranea MF3/22]|uniref:kinase-like protein n=1 Tax=Fomitiporia mediterranea (strain MF3/22) TaxID=694068 RepID=UPI00044080D4|nr:kinase-like protein [Fomitiporia mediterranea MF3/22]EJD08224.1 kinase-like protein [Fomitiporia mediterranea MF3/22]
MSNFKHSTPPDLLESTLARIKHLDITDHLSYDKSAHPFSGGSYGDIRIGTYDHPDRGKLKVAVKCLRVFHTQTPETLKLLKREVQIWSSLDHPNVLPLLGYILEENDFPTLVSEFMENGTALRYVSQHPEIDVTGINKQILGIAEGIDYLHDKGIIHSDLKSDNILISPEGRPLICDFGISRVISLSTSFSGYPINGQTTTGNVKGSARWMSPEILCSPTDQSPAKHTIESDIWAFGMVAYELLTLQRPYYELSNDVQVISAIWYSQLPKKPEDYYTWTWSKKTIWELCNSCWSRNPATRPGMSTVAWLLKAAREDTIVIINRKASTLEILC